MQLCPGRRPHHLAICVGLLALAGPRAAGADEAREDASESVEDVVVRGTRSPTTRAGSFARSEVRQLPGAFADPFRALEAAPGLTPVLTGLPYFYVRGAPPGNVGAFIDGVRVPYLFHFGLGPAVLHPALIAQTELHRGGYPARLGRSAGGVIESSTMPPAERLRVQGHVRAIDAGAIAESPFADGRGSALVSARYSYAAALFSLLASDMELDYRDYQTRVEYALSERDTISLFGFGAYDFAAQRETVDAPGVHGGDGESRAPMQVSRILFASEFHRADARYDRALPRGGHLRAAATVGFDRTRVEARRAVSDVMTGARVELRLPVARGALLRGGADVVVDRYAADPVPDFAHDDDVVARQRLLFAERTDFATGAHLDAVLTLDRVELVPGLRFDVYGSGPATAAAVDPRLAARFFVSDRVRVVHAYGLATQPPAPPLALPAITVAHLHGGLQRAVQTSAAVEVDLPAGFEASAGAFHNAYFGLNDALGSAQMELVDLEQTESLLDKSRGSAFGLELGVRRKLTRRVAGLASYTLSRSLRESDGRRFLSSYDRPHVLTAALSVDLGRGWRSGARFVTYSGIPMRAAEPAFEAQAVGVPPARTPAFHRVDLRVEKRWQIGEAGWVSLVVEALNATLSREVTGYRCPTAILVPGRPEADLTCDPRIMGPVSVPSIGVEGGF